MTIEQLSIGAVVFKRKYFLLLQHPYGHWGLVMGGKENHENDEQTVKRELKEETGITNAEFIHGFKESFEYNYNHKEKTFHKTVICYLVKVNTKNVQLSWEHKDYKWLMFNNAVKRATHENVKNMIRKANAFLKINFA